MAKLSFDFKVPSNLANTLEKNEMKETASKALFRASGVMASTLKSEVGKIPVDENSAGYPRYLKNGEKLNGLTRKEIEDLKRLIYVSEFTKKNGSIQSRIGFASAYIGKPTSTYDAGIPSKIIAGSINKGSSVHKKLNVISNAFAKAQGKAENEIQRTIAEKIKEINSKL